MSSRKSKSGAGKATKKSTQPARRDLGTRTLPKNPTTSGRNEPRNDQGKFAAELYQVKGEGTVEGRRDGEEGLCEVPRSSPTQPLFYDLKQNESPGASSPFNQRSSNNRGRAAQTSRRVAEWPGYPVSSPRQERAMARIESRVREAIVSGLAQTSNSFQKKVDLLQEAFEANSRRTQRAVGQMCNSVNRVKVNLEIVDATLETMNSRLVEFQKGIKTGLKELTVEVGNLASSLGWKGQNYLVNMNDDSAGKSAITIQCAFRQHLARKERARRLKEKEEFEESMEKLERDAFVALVRREQEAAAREREKEERERRRRQEEQKRRSRMLEAAFEGDVGEMQSLLKEMSELDTEDGVAFDGMGQVLRRRHQLDMVDCTDAHGNTPLSEAAGGGHPSAIMYLIDKGADPNSKGAYGRTPLYRAAFGGHIAAVQTLLQSGADPRIHAEDGMMPAEVASTDSTVRILRDWDISTTVVLGEKMEAEVQRRREAEKLQKQEEANRMQNQLSQIMKELSQYHHELQKAYCELHKRINEHDKCVRNDMSKTNITLQPSTLPRCLTRCLQAVERRWPSRKAVHDAEELVAAKRKAVTEAEEKLSLAKLQLRERLQKEASLSELKGTVCHIRELDDVLLKDVGDKIKQDGRWPLVIDPSGQASTFLRYRDTNFHDALNPSHMKPEVLRLGLLGAIRFGKMLVIDMMEVNMFHVVTMVFDQIQAGLMDKLLNKELLQSDRFLSLIRPGDGPEYSRNEFSPSRVKKFQLVLLTKLQSLPPELLSAFYPIQIIIK